MGGLLLTAASNRCTWFAFELEPAGATRCPKAGVRHLADSVGTEGAGDGAAVQVPDVGEAEQRVAGCAARQAIAWPLLDEWYREVGSWAVNDTRRNTPRGKRQMEPVTVSTTLNFPWAIDTAIEMMKKPFEDALRTDPQPLSVALCAEPGRWALVALVGRAGMYAYGPLTGADHSVPWRWVNVDSPALNVALLQARAEMEASGGDASTTPVQVEFTEGKTRIIFPHRTSIDFSTVSLDLEPQRLIDMFWAAGRLAPAEFSSESVLRAVLALSNWSDGFAIEHLAPQELLRLRVKFRDETECAVGVMPLAAGGIA